MHSLVGRFDVKRMPIGVAVNGDGLNPEPLGGPHDPTSNFASVCYQNLLYPLRLRGRECSYYQQLEMEGFVGKLPAEDGGHGRHGFELCE